MAAPRDEPRHGEQQASALDQIPEIPLAVQKHGRLGQQQLQEGSQQKEEKTDGGE